MILSIPGATGRLAVACLAAVLTVSSPDPASAQDPASGAALMASTGLGEMLKGAQDGVRAQITESGGGYTPATIDHATGAFDVAKLSNSIAADLNALPVTTRMAVGKFFASPVGAKLLGLERAIQRQLNAIDGPISNAILHEGGKLKDDVQRGPLTSSVRRVSGAKAMNEALLRATTHALLAASGDLKGVSKREVINEKVDGMIGTTMELINDFDDSAYAYALRDVDEKELRAYTDFWSSAEGTAFVKAVVSSLEKRVDAASRELEQRLKIRVEKTKG